MTDTAPSFRPGSSLPSPRGVDVVWSSLAGLGGMLVGGLLGVLPGLWLEDLDLVLLALPAAVIGSAAGLWLGLMRRGWGWADLGFVSSRRSAWHLCWQVPVALMGVYSCSRLFAAAAGWVWVATDTTSGGALTLAMTVAPWLLVVVSLCVVVLLPAAEEVIFRRVLLGWLLTRMPQVVAVVVAAILFAAVHLVSIAAVYLFFLAVAASMLYLWHRSLWAPLALHAANNALVLTLVAQASNG